MNAYSRGFRDGFEGRPRAAPQVSSEDQEQYDRGYWQGQQRRKLDVK